MLGVLLCAEAVEEVIAPMFHIGTWGTRLSRATKLPQAKENILNFPHTFLDNNYVSVLAFAALAFSLYYFARKPLKK